MLTNPASGHGSAPHAAERAVAQLHQRGVDVVAIAGTDAEHARRLVDGALERGMDALVVVGGDGIISLALQVLAQTDIPLGIIPAGTGNDHAREFRIPTKDPEAAADVVVDGAVETVDLGRIKGADGTDRWFGTVMAAGFDSLVTDRTNRMRWPHGRMRYNVAMVAEISKLRLLPFRLSFDGEELVTDLTLAAFGNTKSYGGGMLICPNADPTDGLLDATMVASASRIQADSPVPHRVQGHPRRPRRGAHRAGPHDHRRVPGFANNQRLRRRRVRLPASGRGVGGTGCAEDPATR